MNRLGVVGRRVAKNVAYTAARAAGPRFRTVRAILMYHDVGGPGGPSASMFERQMEEIVRRSRVVPLRVLPEVLGLGDPLTVVTFDDGYAPAVEAALPVLARLGIEATFFLPSGLLSGPFPTSYGPRRLIGPDAVRSLVAAGHEIGGHTRTHPRLRSVPPDAARGEIVEDRAALTALVGGPITSFAYPKGDFDEAVKAIVREAGYRLAVTVREDLLTGLLDPWALPRVAVNGTMGMAQFRAKLSGGLPTYERWQGRR